MTDPAPPRRRRFTWLNVGELVGVAALAIAGLNFWEGHRERVREDRAQAVSARRAGALLLTGAADPAGDRLKLAPARAEQTIQSQILTLPTEVRADPVRTTGDARIEAGWLEAGVRGARERIGDAGATGVDHRLPVGIETVYLTDGEARTDRAVYDLGYLMQGRLIGGPKVRLEGLSLLRRSAGGELRARVDALWAERTAAETAAVLARRRP